jgi:uncharacterized protein YjdB
MSVSLLTGDLRRVLADIQGRLGILERRITSPASVDNSYEITFSFAGTITAVASPPKRVWKGGDLNVLAVTMGTAGSTSTVLTVERNGTVIATVTVPASTETYNGEVSARFAPDDILVVSVTTAGTGAAEMTADARFT